MSHYYCGKPCSILADLGNEVVIEILTHELVEQEYDGPGYVEPVHTKIIVDKDKVIKDLPDWDAETKLRQKKAEEAFMVKAKSIQDEINELYKSRTLAQEQHRIKVSELQERAKKLEGADQILNWFEGKIKYVAYEGDYGPLRFGVYSLDQLGYKDRDRDAKLTLRAVIFRQDSEYYNGRKAGQIEFQVANYSDGSGGEARWVKGFETEEGASQYLFKFIQESLKDKKPPFGNGNGIRWEWIEFMHKYNFELDIVFQYEEYLHECELKTRQEEIKKKEAEIEALRNKPLGTKKGKK